MRSILDEADAAWEALNLQRNKVLADAGVKAMIALLGGHTHGALASRAEIGNLGEAEYAAVSTRRVRTIDYPLDTAGVTWGAKEAHGVVRPLPPTASLVTEAMTPAEAEAVAAALTRLPSSFVVRDEYAAHKWVYVYSTDGSVCLRLDPANETAALRTLVLPQDDSVSCPACQLAALAGAKS
jgi:hypothetical protein